MAWSTFFGLVMGAYAAYYMLNILYDLFFSRKLTSPAESAVHYNIGNLMGDEEEPYQVAGESDEEQQVYNDQESEDLGDEEYDEDYDDEQEQGYADEIEPEPTPALRVEGQGIPLEDFLKDAKSYAKTIF